MFAQIETDGYIRSYNVSDVAAFIRVERDRRRQMIKKVLDASEDVVRAGLG